MTAKELFEKNASLHMEARKICETVEARDNKEWTGEDQAHFDRLCNEIEANEKRAKNLERSEALAKSLESSAGRATSPVAVNDGAERASNKDKERAAFRKYLCGDSSERRNLQVGSSALGGYIAPEGFFNELQMKLKNDLWIKQFARTIPFTSVAAMNVPTIENSAVSQWGLEIGTVSQDTTQSFGQRQLQPKPLTSLVKVSEMLMMASPLNVEQIVIDDISFSASTEIEEAFTVGTGVGQPLGAFLESANGISSSRNVASGTSASIADGDALWDMVFAIKEQYRRQPSFAWVIGRDILKIIMKLVDGNGNYVFQPSLLVAGAPSMLCGYPIYTSEYVPTAGANSFGAVLGDWSKYLIGELNSLQIRRLDERYADSNEIGFKCLQFVDGLPLFEEAFARLKLSAS